MNRNYKIIIAHPAQQHSYRTAVALKKSGYLHKYITTVYNKNKSLTSFVTKFLKGDNYKRATGRQISDLDDNDILQFCELGSLFLLLLQRVDKKKIFYNKWKEVVTNSFNKKVVKYAMKNNVDAVILYDTWAYTGLKLLKRKAPEIIRIIDMSAPSFAYMDKIFKEDLNKNRKYETSLRQEIESQIYNEILQKSVEEIKLANYFLVASSFSAQSLIHHNIPEKRILITPYGIDSSLYSRDGFKQNRRYKDRKLNCIFVGRVTQKKGAFYLLKAMDRVNQNDFSFKLVGSYEKSNDYFEDYKDVCEFEGHVTKDKMISLYNNADIMIFPSLADGFGLSVLEALSFGIPVICSENAGVSDLIIDGYNGFVIQAGNESEIYNKLKWFSNNREELSKMSENARKTALEYTWEKYNSKINTAIKHIRKCNEWDC